jgi:hypothetical protein
MVPPRRRRRAAAAAAAAAALAATALPPPAAARTVTLSNTALPVDTSGAQILTGEMTVLPWNGTFFVYSNVWGGCAGIDCCTSGACASCCFNPPTPRYNDTCVYTANHSVVVYETPDFATWTYLGVALPPSARRPGIEFRPQVLARPDAGGGTTFVMWYEDRWTGGTNPGYAVATATTPAGPFTTLADSVLLSGSGRIGDYDVFVDDDGAAYHVRTGLTIERLAANWTAGSGTAVDIPNPGVEGPAMFKRGSTYYILVGVGCCACRGGSNVIVYTASSPMGPYTQVGDVGSNVTDGHVFSKSSPWNYVTKAQQTKVVPVPDGAGGTQYLWLGNQWYTAPGPGPGGLGGPRDADLLYFSVLNFNASGAIQQMVWAPTTTLTVP